MMATHFRNKARRFTFFFLGLLGLYSSIPVQAQQLPDQYEMHDIQSDSVIDDIRRCLPKLNGDTIKNASKQAAFGAIQVIFVDPKTVFAPRAQALVFGKQWACVRLSEEGFPLWPVETLDGLLNVQGVAVDVVRQWHRRLLEQIAREGTAKSLVVWPNGAAILVRVFSMPFEPAYVRVTNTFLKAGSYKLEDYPDTLIDPGMKSVSTSNSSLGGADRGNFVIPAKRRFAGLDGDYPVIKGNSAIHHLSLAGTRWRQKDGGSDTAIRFYENGEMNYKSGKSNEDGLWSIKDDVLRIEVKSLGYFFSFSSDDDRRSLSGIMRRQLPAASTSSTELEPGREHQFGLKLEID